MTKRHFIHVYTGNGKGKTTAAIGLTIRALGAGFNVLFAQFLKLGMFNEIKTLLKFNDKITILQFGTGNFVFDNPTIFDKQNALFGLNQIELLLNSKRYDIIILDEINNVLHKKIIDLSVFLQYLNKFVYHGEVILTGRNAPKEIIELADIVTEMKEIKHYYQNGIQARDGIER